MGTSKHIQYLKSDFRGECAFVGYHSYHVFYKFFCKILVLTGFFLKGINAGKNNIYVGILWVKRFQNSTITIGSNCMFVSKQTYNSLGFSHPCMLSTNRADARIVIGNGCSFSGTAIAALQSIVLGENVRCGANTMITDSDWHSDDPRSGGSADVVIEDNVWLGAGSTVLKGVRIGKNSLIGANSLVVRDIPANVVAAGNPCKVIRSLPVND